MVIFMKGKTLILLLVFVFLFASGCAEEGAEPATEESDVSEAAVVAESQENVISGSGKEYIVRLENYGVVRPSEWNISRGDTISWRSDKRQGNYVLVSEEGLFPDEKLSYRVPFTYTFSEAGTYSFVVKDLPEMNVTIRVN
jgi:plastocyanin